MLENWYKIKSRISSSIFFFSERAIVARISLRGSKQQQAKQHTAQLQVTKGFLDEERKNKR